MQQNITKIKINTQNKDQHKILKQIINKIKMNTSQVPFPLCIYKQHTSNNRQIMAMVGRRAYNTLHTSFPNNIFHNVFENIGRRVITEIMSRTGAR